MTRLLPYPLAALGFLLLWLLLQESVSTGAILFGAGLALAVSGILAVLMVPAGRRIRWRPVPGLLRDILVEVFRSNNAVARIILQPRDPAARRSGFVQVPLDLRDPRGLSALACILTATPVPSGWTTTRATAPCCCMCSTCWTRRSGSASSRTNGSGA